MSTIALLMPFLTLTGSESSSAVKIIRAIGLEVAALQGGTKGGPPSVAFRIDLEDGHTVIAETSLKLLLTASDLFRARYGDPR